MTLGAIELIFVVRRLAQPALVSLADAFDIVPVLPDDYGTAN